MKKKNQTTHKFTRCDKCQAVTMCRRKGQHYYCSRQCEKDNELTYDPKKQASRFLRIQLTTSFLIMVISAILTVMVSPFYFLLFALAVMNVVSGVLIDRHLIFI